MRKWVILLAAALLLLTVRVRAAEFPREMEQALPKEAESVLDSVELEKDGALAAGLGVIWEKLAGKAGDVVRRQVRGAAGVLLAVALCGAAEGAWPGEKASAALSMVGALSVSLATAGSLEDLMGLGVETMRQLGTFSTVLLPTLAAATAASGALSAASAQQVAAMFFVDVLLRLVNGLLVPLVYLYVGVLTASACLPENRLGALAAGLKKAATWLLTTSLTAFTLYLTAVRVISGGADAMTVKVARAAISGVVPVVGGIIAEASETVLAGAGVLRGVVGLGGLLAVLAACAYPFLQLAVQYLLYKLTAYLASLVGPAGLYELIDGLGGAFGLVLGMTGACAMLLLVSILTFVGAVVP